MPRPPAATSSRARSMRAVVLGLSSAGAAGALVAGKGSRDAGIAARLPGRAVAAAGGRSRSRSTAKRRAHLGARAQRRSRGERMSATCFQTATKLVHEVTDLIWDLNGQRIAAVNAINESRGRPDEINHSHEIVLRDLDGDGSAFFIPPSRGSLCLQPIYADKDVRSVLFVWRGVVRFRPVAEFVCTIGPMVEADHSSSGGAFGAVDYPEYEDRALVGIGEFIQGRDHYAVASDEWLLGGAEHGYGDEQRERECFGDRASHRNLARHGVHSWSLL